jgi:hypothetical protein
MASASGTSVDLGDFLNSSLAAVVQQGVSDNQRLAQNTLLAYQRDLFLSGQEATAPLLASLNTADRTPVVKTA